MEYPDLTWFQQAWLWLGNEIAVFGVRWLFFVVVMIGFSGWFGWRYREMSRELAELKANRGQPVINIKNVVASETDKAKPPKQPAPSVPDTTKSVAKHIPHDRIVRVGTKAGPMEIRLWDEAKTIEDITVVLYKNDVIASLDE